MDRLKNQNKRFIFSRILFLVWVFFFGFSGNDNFVFVNSNFFKTHILTIFSNYRSKRAQPNLQKIVHIFEILSPPKEGQLLFYQIKMPVRFLLRFLSHFANNEQLVSRLAESRPIRRSAQLVAYLYHRSVALMQSGSIRQQTNRMITFKDRFASELKTEIEAAKEKLKKQ